MVGNEEPNENKDVASNTLMAAPHASNKDGTLIIAEVDNPELPNVL